MRAATPVFAICALSLLAGCGPSANHNQAVYVLVDTSGSYTKEVGKAQAVVNYVLGNLEPGDSLAVARVKSRSFTEKDFSDKMAEFAKATHASKGSAYTDITGGVMQAAEFLNETGAGRKTIIIFSDMQEELDTQTKRDFPIKLDGIRIIALNVSKLGTDNIDPRRYMGRLEWWEQRTRAAGAIEWRVVNDMEHLERVFARRG